MKRKWICLILLSILITLVGCSNPDAEELENYVEQMQSDMHKEMEVDVHLTTFGNLIMDGKPEEAVELLETEIIPAYDELVAKYKGVKLEGEDAIETNSIVVRLLQGDLDTQRLMHEIFTEIMEKVPEDRVDEIDIDAKLDDLRTINEGYVAAAKDYHDQILYLLETYDFLEMEDENSTVGFANFDAAQFDANNELLISIFTEVVTAQHFADGTEGEATEEEEETEESAPTSTGDFVVADEAMLADKGNPNVALDATVTIEANQLQITGDSNLLPGSTVYFTSEHYGSENPYLRDELTVADDGSFELTAELSEEQLNEEPLTLSLSYQPDKEDQEAQDIYGAEGERIEGPFKKKYTNIKRTRLGAFIYAEITFGNGVEQQFQTVAWEAPDDQGDMNIWMEKGDVETKETYYTITMDSNLAELTWIKARVEIPGYESAGMTSRTEVRPDGSFRFQIPRPDIDSNEVIVVIEVEPDGALETEELYGVYGENFEGDLTEKTDRGEKIVYELQLGEDS